MCTVIRNHYENEYVGGNKDDLFFMMALIFKEIALSGDAKV
jgi:hypothetical protein